MTEHERARAQFVTWLMQAHPELAERALQYAENWRLEKAAEQGDPHTLAGLGETPTGEVEEQSFWSKLTEGLTSLATGVLAYKTQKQVLEANIVRANQGLPPIDMATGAPVIKTQVDVSPEILARLQATAAEGTRKILLWGGVGLAAYFLLRPPRRRRHA